MLALAITESLLDPLCTIIQERWTNPHSKESKTTAVVISLTVVGLGSNRCYSQTTSKSRRRVAYEMSGHAPSVTLQQIYTKLQSPYYYYYCYWCRLFEMQKCVYGGSFSFTCLLFPAVYEEKTLNSKTRQRWLVNLLWMFVAWMLSYFCGTLFSNFFSGSRENIDFIKILK